MTGVVSSPYLYVFAGSSAAAMLLYQVGLQSCRASILVPVSTVTGSVYFLIAGTWLFHEHLPANPAKLGPAPGRDRGSRARAHHPVPAGTGQASGEAGPGPATVPGYAGRQ